MKSLDQIEPRIPVDAVHTPGNGIFVSYQITQPGSYYLTTNIVGCPNQSGIFIYANNVTLDLNGFSMFGATNSSAGIATVQAQTNLIIRNGQISGWMNGVSVHYSFNCQFERLILSSNFAIGLWTGVNSAVTGCTAVNNGDGFS